MCELKAANGIVQHCEGEQCVFWRAVDQLGQPVGIGCAVQHYQLLGDEGMAEWLLSVRERVTEKSRSGS